MKPSLQYLRRAAQVLAMASVFMHGVASAQSEQIGPSGRQPPPPPEEAIAACQSLQAGAACSFSIGDRQITCACGAPEGRPLACRPKNAPAAHGGETSKPKQP